MTQPSESNRTVFPSASKKIASIIPAKRSTPKKIASKAPKSALATLRRGSSQPRRIASRRPSPKTILEAGISTLRGRARLDDVCHNSVMLPVEHNDPINAKNSGHLQRTKSKDSCASPFEEIANRSGLGVDVVMGPGSVPCCARATIRRVRQTFACDEPGSGRAGRVESSRGKRSDTGLRLDVSNMTLFSGHVVLAFPPTLSVPDLTTNFGLL